LNRNRLAKRLIYALKIILIILLAQKFFNFSNPQQQHLLCIDENHFTQTVMPLEEKNSDSNTVLKNARKPTESRPKTATTTPAKTTPAKKSASKIKSNPLNSKENQTKLTDFLKTKSTKVKENEPEPRVQSPKSKTAELEKSPVKVVTSPKPTVSHSSTPTSPITRSKSALLMTATTSAVNKVQKNGKSPAKKICTVREEEKSCNKGISCNMDKEIHDEDDDSLVKSLTLSAEQLKLKETDRELFWEQAAEAVRVELAEYLEDNKGVSKKMRLLWVNYIYFC